MILRTESGKILTLNDTPLKIVDDLKRPTKFASNGYYIDLVNNKSSDEGIYFHQSHNTDTPSYITGSFYVGLVPLDQLIPPVGSNFVEWYNDYKYRFDHVNDIGYDNKTWKYCIGYKPFGQRIVLTAYHAYFKWQQVGGKVNTPEITLYKGDYSIDIRGNTTDIYATTEKCYANGSCNFVFERGEEFKLNFRNNKSANYHPYVGFIFEGYVE